MIKINKEDGIHKILDIESSQVSRELIDYINNYLHYTYRDTINPLNEHLYSQDILSEAEEWANKDKWNDNIKNTLEEIETLCREHEAAYWRIINQ